MTKKFFSVLTLAILAMLLSFQSAHAMTTIEFYRLARKQKHIQPFAVTVQSACETAYWSSELWELVITVQESRFHQSGSMQENHILPRIALRAGTVFMVMRLPNLENTDRRVSF